jgi:outer membrane biogenesis lipoprotein LolB
MKWMLIILSIGFLPACVSLNNSHFVDTNNKVPRVWQVSGRIGVKNKDKYESVGFQAKFKPNRYHLKLKVALGLGQVNIRQNEGDLTIDNKAVLFDLKTWMLSQAGWYFPIEELGNIIFKQKISQKDWNLTVVSPLPNNFLRKAVLVNLEKKIKITLIFKSINVKKI